MTDVNHRRKNRAPVNQRYPVDQYHNGYAAGYGDEGEDRRGKVQRVGNTDFLDKSMHGWGRISKLADRLIGASIGNDYCRGHRGMAKAVKGAKKFVRTRTRFHENAAAKRLGRDASDED